VSERVASVRCGLAAEFPVCEPLREAAFDALQTQLRLKAVPKRVAVEMLVIDHVEKALAYQN